MNFSKYFEAYPVHDYMNIFDPKFKLNMFSEKCTHLIPSFIFAAMSGLAQSNINQEHLYLVLATSTRYL